MGGTRSQASFADRLRGVLHRLIALADQSTDDDDLRLRKRVGVVAGYVIGLGALQLPIMAQGIPLSWAMALTMSPVAFINLALLARTKRFDRYVAVLILAVILFPAFVDLALGGMAGSSGGYIFAFAGPLFAILALGPRRATAWLIVYLAILGVLILVDPIVSRAIPPQPYALRLIFYASNLSAPLLIVFFFLRYSELRRRQAQARADELLFNAIPASIAARLKRGEQRIAETYPSTTVVFADLAGFTPWAQRTDPGQVVSFLDGLFTRFDELAAESGVEKIKTVGDAYMAVAGALEPRADHASTAIAFGKRMLSALEEARREGHVALELRIGIASGPVVGGVIGQRRILFDLWGDTVNLASRMQTTGIPGRIHVTASTRELAADDWAFEAQEPMEIKGVGPMTTYLVAA